MNKLSAWGPFRSATGLLLSTAFIVAPGDAFGAVRRVPFPFPTIQHGVDAAAFGDTVLVAAGTYSHFQTRGTHTSCVFLKDGVVLRSESGPEVTIIDGWQLVGPQPSVVECAAAFSDVTLLEGFTITNRARGFRGLAVFDRFRVRNCVFQDLDELGSGGAGAAVNGDIVFESCRFFDCHANTGGALYHSNGTLAMYDCEIRECGSIGVFVNENGGGPLESAWIENCTFIDCGDKGALRFSYIVRPVTVRNCVFVNNKDTSTGGGAIAMGSIGSKTVEGCLFIGNQTTSLNSSGGAIETSRNALIRNNTFWGNVASLQIGGSAIRFGSGGNHILSNNVFAAGIGAGGAIDDQFGGVTSSCNVFWENEDGAGIFFVPGATDREIDPQFCDPVTFDFTLNAASPCLPKNSLGCDLIGAFGPGCGTVSVQPWSWGKIKGAYRSAPEGVR